MDDARIRLHRGREDAIGNLGSHHEDDYEPSAKVINDTLGALDRNVSDRRNEQIARALVIVGVVIGLSQLVIGVWPGSGPDGGTSQIAFLVFGGLLVVLGMFFLTVFNTQGRILRERCLKLESSRARMIHQERIAGLGPRGAGSKAARRTNLDEAI